MLKLYRFTSIRKKMAAYSLISILVPVLMFGVMNYRIYKDYYEQKLVDSYERTNRQLSQNITSFIESLHNATVFSGLDSSVYESLSHTYEGDTAAYERILDYRIISETLLARILQSNPLIRDAVIYQIKADTMYIKTNDAYVSNYRYQPKDEWWYNELIQSDGGVQIYRNKTEDVQDGTFVVARTIMDPFSWELLGVLIIHIKNDQLSQLYAEEEVSDSGIELIVDDDRSVIYSNLLVGQRLDSDIDFDSIDDEGGIQLIQYRNDDYYIIRSEIGGVDWHALSLIPRSDLLLELQGVRTVMALIIIGLLITLSVLSFVISESIARPIVKLKNSMVDVEKGNLALQVEVKGEDEVAQLGQKFNKMIRRINGLFKQVHVEEEKKRCAELKALQNQIGPHFLYNTLGTIQFIAEMHGIKTIVEALDDLIWLFKSSTETSDEFVPLSKEIQFLKRNVKILNLRFMKEVTFHVDADPVLLEVPILKFMLQPIVENAFMHGLDNTSNHPKIDLVCQLEQGVVSFSITDNGKGLTDEEILRVLSKEKDRSSINAVGLPNIIERLNSVYGDAFSFEIRSEAVTTVTIKIDKGVII